MAVLIVPPFLQFFDDDGNPLAGGKVHTYVAGTNTKKATYTNAAGNIQASNPLILDAAGRVTMWGAGAYKFYVTDALDNPVGPNGGVTDNVQTFNVTSSGGSAFFDSLSGNAIQTAFTLSAPMGTDSKALMIFIGKGTPECATNGTFATDTAWTKGAGWSIGAGVATATGAISTALSQTSAEQLVEGQLYRVTYTITRSAGGLIPSVGGTAGTERTSAGTYTDLIIAGSTQTLAFTGNGFTGTLDNVKINLVATAGMEIQNPASYTINGVDLQFSTPPGIGNNNIFVFAPSSLVGAAAASAADAEAFATAAENAKNDAETARDDILNNTSFIAVSNDLLGPNTIGAVAANIANVNDVAANESNINAAVANLAAIIAAPAEASSAAASALAAQTAASAVANLWNFDTSTTMADPGSTDIRFNNAALASVTAIAISANSADTGNPDLSDYIVTWDDSSHTPKGLLSVRTGDGDIALFGIMGAVTDNTSWLEIPVSYIAGTASLSDGEDCYISFTGYGNDGTGTGDVEASGMPTSGQLPIWTGPKTIKGVTASGDATVDGNGVILATNAIITGKPAIAPDVGDSLLFSDADDSGNLKKATLTNILSLVTMAMLKSGTMAAGVGAVATSGSLGTISSGTVTPLATSNGNFNHYTNNGAHTLAPPAGVCTMIIEVTNGASAGAITVSGYTKTDTAEYNTTNGNKFHFYITKTNSYSALSVVALQ